MSGEQNCLNVLVSCVHVNFKIKKLGHIGQTNSLSSLLLRHQCEKISTKQNQEYWYLDWLLLNGLYAAEPGLFFSDFLMILHL